MPLHRIVEDYSNQAPRCRSKEELFSLSEAAARDLGFDRLAIVQGLWFRYPDLRLIRMDNWGDYAELFIRRKYFLHDPALLSCQRINTAFPWPMTRKLIRYSRNQEEIIKEAVRHGLRIGFTLPVGVTGEPPGCCSFVTSRSELPSTWNCRAAAIIGAEFFREARRLHGFPSRAPQVPNISVRKLEVLRLLALGTTDAGIAAKLGIKPSTVDTYMKELRLAFDVHSRAQLIATALRYGLIAFEDSIGY